MMSQSLKIPASMPTMGERQLSNASLPTSATCRTTTPWGHECLLRRRNKLSRSRLGLTSPDAKIDFSNGDVNNRSRGSPKSRQSIKKYYIDQQTGEMRLLTNGKSAMNALITNPNEVEQNDIASNTKSFANPMEPRWRRRSSSDSSAVIFNRPMWDHSLISKSIMIGQRSHTQSSQPIYYYGLPRTAPQIGPSAFLPRSSRSAEGSTGFEISNSRYPRGQQRPTSIVSGHHALLVRHKEILEASKRTPREMTWSILPQKDAKLLQALRERHPDIEVQYLNNPTGKQTLPPYRTPKLHKFPDCDNTIAQQRCSQEASMSRANKKCQDWFNTWIDD